MFALNHFTSTVVLPTTVIGMLMPCSLRVMEMLDFVELLMIRPV